jgi:hypothetical protein
LAVVSGLDSGIGVLSAGSDSRVSTDEGDFGEDEGSRLGIKGLQFRREISGLGFDGLVDARCGFDAWNFL